MNSSTQGMSDGDDFKTANNRGSIGGPPTRQNRLSLFFSLPPEIRNTITHLIFVSDSLHLCRPEGQHEREETGFQSLATCRQAYGEGHTLFCSLNIF